MFLKISDYLSQNKRAPLSDMVLPNKPVDSAVVLLCFKEGPEDHILLTKRSELVAHHKGQVGLPGGVRDAGDESLWATALRETHEELGLPANLIQFIGELGTVVTPTGFHITPFVATLKVPFVLTPNADEIAEVFSVSIPHLLDTKNFCYQPKTYFGRDYQDPVFTYKNHQIWGATGRILCDMLEVWRQLSVKPF